MSEPDSPAPPPQAPLHVDEDEIYPVTLGPTHSQLIEMYERGTPESLALAGHLALLSSFAERGEVPPPDYVGEHPVPVAREVIEMLGESLLGRAGWEYAKEVNDKYAKEAQERKVKLQRVANDKFPDFSIDAGEIADNFLNDPDMAELVTVRAKGGAKRPMNREWLRKIIAAGRK
jgi:hypothetical protein